MKKNKLMTKAQVMRAAYTKRIVTALLAVGVVFAAPKVWNAYRTAQKEQLAKVKHEMHEQKLQAEFRAAREAALKAEREEEKRMMEEAERSQKRMKAKAEQDRRDMEALWKAGIYPENDDTTY